MLGSTFAIEDLVLRLAAACLAGLVVGLDRELRHRPAGMRTHMLVSLASALFTLLAFELVEAADDMSPAVQSDPVRVVEAVLTGVAFLGAGTIIRAGRQVQGVTTGASIWLVGALGVACGGGFYLLAVIGAVMTMVILTGLGWVERHILGTDGAPVLPADDDRERRGAGR